LTEEEILKCCREGYSLGLRTFVLQGGEDPVWRGERIAALVREIKNNCPDCAVTLSLGEHSKEVYRLWKEAGADRYLLRHETATADHYRQLHPARQSWERRMQCLKDLKEIGYQTGCGFMVGSPGQTVEHLVEELIFLQEFQPHMVGIGPFIPQKDTPFADEKAGTLEQTLLLLSLIRLLLPKVLLPATTALGTIHSGGRELGFLAGANVCMPNLSPAGVRKHYAIYDNKLSDGAEAVESLGALQKRLQTVGCEMSLSRGDYVDF
jgi:biotin synthase